jgi:tetratricopeptide (TPR) repeat protein
VRARATLLIVKNLRGQSDARWQTISNDWLALPGAKDKIIVAELRKLNLAHARITNPTPAAKRQLAQAVLNTPGISPGEWLAATKQVITTKFAQNQTPDMETRLTDGAAMFGAAFRPQFTHGLALACQKAGRADLATTLFQSNVNNADASTEQKNKSLWALARLQSAQGDHAGAAQSFWSYSQNVNVPQRFAAYALVQWVTELAATNQPGLMAQAKPKIEAVLPQITDYELLLDLARKVFNLRTGDASWFSFSRQIFQRGQQVALQAFNAASEPSVAAGILFKLCRRASTDFHDHATVLAVWSQLTDTKKLWLWSEQQDYWYLQELVFRAYRDGGQATAAEQFITPLLNDPATPPTGLAILGTSYAVLKRNQKDLPAMFAAYEKVTQAAPAHEWSSSAYYWFALRAWNQGSATQAATYADKLLQVLSGSVELYWKKDYTAAAWLLKAGLQPAQVPVQANLAATVLQKQLQVMQTDLALLNA